MLPIKEPMEDAWVVKLHEPSPTQCLYVAHARNMAGRIPLMPCFLVGNTTPTIPHKYRKDRNSCFPAGCADTAADDSLADGRRCSNVYEVNPWLWQQFGRGKPSLGSLTIEQTLDRQDAASKASDKCQKETSEGCKGDGS
jgi:hypothetical protein